MICFDFFFYFLVSSPVMLDILSKYFLFGNFNGPEELLVIFFDSATTLDWSNKSYLSMLSISDIDIPALFFASSVLF